VDPNFYKTHKTNLSKTEQGGIVVKDLNKKMYLQKFHTFQLCLPVDCYCPKYFPLHSSALEDTFLYKKAKCTQII